MDWISTTYNKLEGLAVAADRLLGIVIERCEGWAAGRKAELTEGSRGEPREMPGSVRNARPGRPFSA